jgi:hypothetical protein
MAGKRKISAPQLIFAKAILDGLSQKKAYLMAYPNSSPSSAGANGHRLLNTESVRQYVESRRQKQETAETLTRTRKREFLAGVVAGNADRELTPLQLQAIAIDNKMAGHDAPERVEVSVNPLEKLVHAIQLED